MTGTRLLRPPSVAGTFYPADPIRLRDTVRGLLDEASGPTATAGPSVVARPAGILVPHAGLMYSGRVAAAGWRQVGAFTGSDRPTIVILGTNHGAGWLDGVGAWPRGAWQSPLGEVTIDGDLAEAILDLGAPFLSDEPAHIGEHSIEVQLPFIQVVVPGAPIVPLAVSTGTGAGAAAAGRALGRLLADRAAAGAPVVLAISSDMAHYPPHDVCGRVTRRLMPAILATDPAALAADEAALRQSGERDLLCGMCGIEPAVVGLAALAELHTPPPRVLAAATSADAGGDPDRTVGYLAVAWPA